MGLRENDSDAWSPIQALLATGITVREIAEEIGIGKSVVHRMKQRFDRGAKEEAAGQDEGE